MNSDLVDTAHDADTERRMVEAYFEADALGLVAHEVGQLAEGAPFSRSATAAEVERRTREYVSDFRTLGKSLGDVTTTEHIIQLLTLRAVLRFSLFTGTVRHLLIDDAAYQRACDFTAQVSLRIHAGASDAELIRELVALDPNVPEPIIRRYVTDVREAAELGVQAEVLYGPPPTVWGTVVEFVRFLVAAVRLRLRRRSQGA